MTVRATASPFMEWAKTRSAARFNLSRSGLPDQPLSALGATHARPAETLALRAFAVLPDLARGFGVLLETNRALFAEFVSARSDLACFLPPHGTVVFPRWLWGNADPLCTLLREKHETTVVPGEFFGSPDHFRLGLCVEAEIFREGIARLGQALDEIAKR